MIDFNSSQTWLMFSEKATKRDEISTLVLRFTSKRQIKDGDFVFFGLLIKHDHCNFLFDTYMIYDLVFMTFMDVDVFLKTY